MANQGMNDEAAERLELNHAVIFITLTGEQISAQVKQITLTVADELSTCAIRLEMEWPAYQQILSGEWFGLHQAARGGSSEVSFEHNRPVELTAYLRQSVAGTVLPDGAGIEDVLQALLGENLSVNVNVNVNEKANKAIPLLMSESWLVAEVKQQVALPDELAADGILKKGYRTIWAKPSTLQVAPAEQKPALNEIVEQFLRAWEWTFERVDESILSLKFRGEQGEWVVLIRTDEAKQLCIVYSIYPVMVPEQRRPSIAAWLTQENYDLPIGNFEMDAADGELRFRTGIDVEHDRLTTELFGQLLTTNLAVMDQYFPQIAKHA